MTILAITQLVLAGLGSVLGMLTKSNAPEEVISEIQSAIASLETAQNQVATLAELESLRTQKLW